MDCRDILKPRFRVLASLAGCVAAVALASAPAARADTPTHKVVKVVLEKKTGTFTHKLNLDPGQRLLLRINADNVAEAIEKAQFVPPGEFMVLDSEDLAERAASRLYPDVLSFGKADDLDFDLEEFWKLLLGGNVTLHCQQTKQASSKQSDATDDSRSGSGGQTSNSTTPQQYAISGKLLGYAEGDDDSFVLKILGNEDKTVYEIDEDSIVSLEFGNALSGDVKKALATLKTSVKVDESTVVIERACKPEEKTEGTCEGAPSDENEFKMTYSQALEHKWIARFQGEIPEDEDKSPGKTQNAPSDKKKLIVHGWARIRNETPYAWDKGIEVILKTDNGKYPLKNVVLKSGESGWFAITFPKKDKDQGRTDDVTKLELDYTQRPEIVVPDKEEAKNQKLRSLDTLIVSNNTEYTLPAGSLSIENMEETFRNQEIEKLPAGGKKEIPVAIGYTTDNNADDDDDNGVAVAVWDKKAGTVCHMNTEGPLLDFRTGTVSTLAFSRQDGEAKWSGLKVNEEDENDKAFILQWTKPDGTPATDLTTIHLRLPASPKDKSRAKYVRKVTKENKEKEQEEEKEVLSLVVFEWLKSADSIEISSVANDTLNLLKELLLSEQFTGIVQRVAKDHATMETLEKNESRLVHTMKQLEERREFHFNQPQSGAQHSILRRIATLKAQYERHLALVRNNLAVARYRLDHDVRGPLAETATVTP